MAASPLPEPGASSSAQPAGQTRVVMTKVFVTGLKVQAEIGRGKVVKG